MKLLRQLCQDKLAAICLLFLASVAIAGALAPFVAPHDPNEIHMNLRYAGASSAYWLGNDHLGRCILSRIIYGIRPSVFGVLVTLFASAGIGAVVGLIAGYAKGKTEAFLMRICDVMLSFPGYVMMLAVIGILGVGLDHILIAFVLMKWAWFARMIRTSVLQFSDADYIKYSRTLGVRHIHIILKHIVPVSFPDIAVISSSAFGSMILQISGFSFLGFGIQAPGAEWGMMLNEARSVMFSKPELMLAPGIAIVAVVSAANFLSDALQNALDPNLRAIRHTRRGMPTALDAKLQGKEVA